MSKFIDLAELVSKENTERLIRESQEKKRKSCKKNNVATNNSASVDSQGLKKFYVYVLIDPRDNEVFYVGKGTGERVLQHSLDAAKEHISETAKLNQIRKIADQGLEETRLIVGRFETSEEAHAVESILIHWTYGIENLTNDVSGHGGDYVRPKGVTDPLPGIDIPELSFSESEKEKRKRFRVVEFLKEIEQSIEKKYGITFDNIDTITDEKHTYLYKLMCDVKLCIVTHHNPRRSATVTLQCVQKNDFYKEQIISVASRTRFSAKDNGRYARIEPAGTLTMLDDLHEKFIESYNELLAYKEKYGD